MPRRKFGSAILVIVVLGSVGPPAPANPKPTAIIISFQHTTNSLVLHSEYKPVSNPHSALTLNPRFSSTWALNFPMFSQVPELLDLKGWPRSCKQLSRLQPLHPKPSAITQVEVADVEAKTRRVCAGVPTRRANEDHFPSLPSLCWHQYTCLRLRDRRMGGVGSDDDRTYHC